MRFSTTLFLGLLARATLVLADLADYVLTDTGTIHGGNDFPGVSYPFGIVKLGPDLHTGRDSYSGYQPHGRVMGFSMLHESGTGGAPKYGVVAQMPAFDANGINWAGIGYEERAEPDHTEVGYYRTVLKSGIVVELGATNKAGMLRYQFPGGKGGASVVVDVSHVLPSFRGNGWGQHYKGGGIRSLATGEGMGYRGWGDYDNGWNAAPTWRVFFCGHFDKPGCHMLVREDDDSPGPTCSNTMEEGESNVGIGMIYHFDTGLEGLNLTSRIGVSFISEERACENLNGEIPLPTAITTTDGDSDSASHSEGSSESDSAADTTTTAMSPSISSLRATTRRVWESEVLSKVTTGEADAADEENLKLLYTSLYFMHLLPVNKTGENPAPWASSSKEPYYDDVFTLWDLFRCTTPLFHVLQPRMYTEFVRSLVDVWRYEGFMPDGRSSFANGAVQGGSNADNVLADAYVKGVGRAGERVGGGLDWEDGLRAMIKNAEVVPENEGDRRDRTGSVREGRGALEDWRDKGFVTRKFARSVSRAVEYAANDFAVYQVASGLNHPDAEIYLNRSRNWRNHWNTNMKAHGHTGFVGPRKADGNHEFITQDPMSCGHCYWGADYYQATPWLYTLNPHHDLRTLVSLSGGPTNFTSRLNITFSPAHQIFDPSNEPSFTTPYLYHYISRPDLSIATSRNIAKTLYSATPSGLPGNSDAGAMQSWVLWNMIGLYPVTGQDVFLVGSGWFRELSIWLDDPSEGNNGTGGRRLRITTDYTSPVPRKEEEGREGYFHIHNLTLNGQAWKQSWFSYQDLFKPETSSRSNGTEIQLHFTLAPQPNMDWFSPIPPPSPATEEGLSPAELVKQVEERVKDAVTEELDNNKKMEQRKIGFIVGGVVGGVGDFIVLVWLTWRWFGRKTQEGKPVSVSDLEGGKVSNCGVWWRMWRSGEIWGSEGVETIEGVGTSSLESDSSGNGKDVKDGKDRKDMGYMFEEVEEGERMEEGRRKSYGTMSSGSGSRRGSPV